MIKLYIYADLRQINISTTNERKENLKLISDAVKMQNPTSFYCFKDGVSGNRHDDNRKMLNVDLISNGTNINLVPSRSLDSLCSVASSSSFAYVPIT